MDSEEIKRLYWEEGLSIQTIAEKFEVWSSVIYHIMQQNNIPRRSIAEAWALRSGRILTIGEINKTHKFCPRCGEIKPVAEFYCGVKPYNDLASYCKKCYQEYSLTSGGRSYFDLHKRSFPLDGRCEICNIKLGKSCYHHWDDDNLDLGVWMCNSCDFFTEGIDEIDKNPWKVNIYRRLRGEVEETERAYTGNILPPGPPNGVYRLFLNGKQTHKWCPHCGQMKPVAEFHKRSVSYDGFYYWCKKCRQTSKIANPKGRQFFSLHKRPKPNSCELCSGQTHLNYHHWDDNNRSKGVWVCQTNKCHNLAEAVDRLGNGSPLPNKYSKLKQGIILGKV